MAELRASPVVNPSYKRIADVLANLQGPMGEIIPFTDANPFKFLMPAASTFENLAYGNSPLSEYAGVTNRRLPIVKTGRENELTDIADVALMASGLPMASRGVARGANYLGDVLTQATRAAPPAAPMRGLEKAYAEAEQRIAGLVEPQAGGDKTKQFLEMAEKGRLQVAPDDPLAQFLSSSKPPKPNPTYGMEHRPMGEAGGASRLHEAYKSFGEDVYGKNALQYFGSGDPREAGVVRLMRSIRDNPDREVTIYRGVPEGLEGKINPGDWITLDKNVAEDYGKVVSMKVKAKDITTWPDSLLEFGYFPE
jgi:hypothetical protein